MYELSLTRKQLTMWIAAAAVLAALIFVMGLMTGINLALPHAASANALPSIPGTKAKDAQARKQDGAAVKAEPVDPVKADATKTGDPKHDPGKPDSPRPEDDIYCIQLGAFPDLKAARQLQADLKERGYTTVLYKAIDGDQRMWNLVRIGGFKDLASATQAASDFTSKEQIQALVRRTGSL